MRAFVLDRVVPPLKGLNRYIDYYYPALASWSRQECRPCRAHLRFHRQSITWLFECRSPESAALAGLISGNCQVPNLFDVFPLYKCLLFREKAVSLQCLVWGSSVYPATVREITN